MNYDYEFIRNELYRDFNDESIALVLSLQRNDVRGVEKAVQMIARKYHKMKDRYTEQEYNIQLLTTQKRQLEEKVRSLENELNNKTTTYKAPNHRELDDAAMYADWLETKSFRQTAKNFGCDRGTVRKHFLDAKYQIDINKLHGEPDIAK